MKTNRCNARRCSKRRGHDTRHQVRGNSPAAYVAAPRERAQQLLDLSEVRRHTRN
jgi:hypothetical protein